MLKLWNFHILYQAQQVILDLTKNLILVFIKDF